MNKINKDQNKQDKLTIYYDGNCPLCSLEMQKLKRYDDKKLIILVNLQQDNFTKHFPHINVANALQILHGEYQGKLLLALDVTHRAWTLVGRGALVAPLQFPVIKQVAHASYLLLAKYRYPISNFLHQRFGIGIKTCDKGTCYANTNNINRRR
jgi:predicted DCC family thiol-disulfide oxidoreductase YuxK